MSQTIIMKSSKNDNIEISCETKTFKTVQSRCGPVEPCTVPRDWHTCGERKNNVTMVASLKNHVKHVLTTKEPSPLRSGCMCLCRKRWRLIRPPPSAESLPRLRNSASAPCPQQHSILETKKMVHQLYLHPDYRNLQILLMMQVFLLKNLYALACF